MDAVQQAGNGHPGTAMALAPAAYLLFRDYSAMILPIPPGSAGIVSSYQRGTRA